MVSKNRKFWEWWNVQQEIQFDKRELRKLGLSEEEVEGYVEFFAENWYDIQKSYEQQKGQTRCLDGLRPN